MTKRALSWFLALLTVLSLCAPALAEDGEEELTDGEMQALIEAGEAAEPDQISAAEETLPAAEVFQPAEETLQAENMPLEASAAKAAVAEASDTDINLLAEPRITAVSNTATGVKITWGAVSGASRYRLFYKNGAGWTRIADTTSLSYIWQGAKGGTAYTFTVRCVSADGKSYASGYDRTGVSITYLKMPVISAVANTAAGIKITWNKVSGAGQYRVYCKTGSGSWTKIAVTTDASFTWTGAKNGTKYAFTVRAFSKDNASASSYDSAGKSITYLSAPVISSLTNTEAGVKIAWGKVAGAAKYRVFYKTGSGGWKKIADTASTSYTWTGAKGGTAYSITVRCLSADGKRYTSGYRTGSSITYQAPQLAAPKITALSNTVNGVKITWGKVAGAAKYRVFYKTAGGWKKIADTTSTSYTWTGAAGGTAYTFTVRCLTSSGTAYASGYDKAGMSITYVKAPTVTALENTASGIKVTWGKAAGAERYRVYYKPDGGSWTRFADTADTSCTWTGAKSGTKYSFTVRCMAADGKTFTSGYDNTGRSITYVAAPVLSGVTNTTAGVKITWGKVTGAAKYRVFYKTGSGSWTKITDTTSTSCTWDGGKNGVKYTFTVRCVSADGKSYASGYDKTGMTLAYEKPDWVADLSEAKRTDQILVVSVTGTSAAVSFHQKDAGGVWKEVFSTNGYIGSGGLGKTVAGDKKTPVGVYHFTDAFGICADPGSVMPYTKVDSSHWWVGDSDSAYYNSFASTDKVTQDWKASLSEHLIDYPTVYNYVLALDYNSQRTPNAGSAIFVHCSRTPGSTTNGCVAIPEAYMIRLLQLADGKCSVIIDAAGNIGKY